MKNWTIQAERVFKRLHLGQSEADRILLPIVKNMLIMCKFSFARGQSRRIDPHNGIMVKTLKLF
jgi:hypothetical protein